MQQIKKNWEEIQTTIVAACARSGRNPQEVKVVAVTKYSDLETTRQVLDLGLTEIGESRAQEAVPKYKALGDRGTWHFIGHLQRNKVKDVVGRFTYIHSLDRFSLAQEISRRAEKVGCTMRCFIQVNVAGEASKFGLAPAEVMDFAEEVVQLPFLHLEGLMTMAPRVEVPEETRPVFRQLAEMRRKLQEEKGLSLPHLSMGMSQDYEIAVEEGATWLRLGSVLVGGTR